MFIRNDLERKCAQWSVVSRVSLELAIRMQRLETFSRREVHWGWQIVQNRIQQLVRSPMAQRGAGKDREDVQIDCCFANGSLQDRRFNLFTHQIEFSQLVVELGYLCDQFLSCGVGTIQIFCRNL